MIAEIELALEERSLDALDALARPQERVINRSEHFRSALMLSAHKLKHLLKVPTLEAECIMINLEDGVSQDEKVYALVLTAIFLAEYKQCDKKLIVRVNALDEGGIDEIIYLNQFHPDAIRVPKIRTPEEVRKVLSLVDDACEVHLSIETGDAWTNLAWLAVDQRVTTFYLGVLDLFADLRLPQSLITPDNPMMSYMLSHFLITAKAIGVKPVSFVFQEYRDLDGLREWLTLEKRLGFTAKGCISPDQVKVVHEVFVDDAEQIERAHAIIELFEAQRAIGVTGFTDEKYGFIDEPIYKGALALLEGKG